MIPGRTVRRDAGQGLQRKHKADRPEQIDWGYRGLDKAKGRIPLRAPTPSIPIFEDPESAPDYTYLPLRVSRATAGMTRTCLTTFAVAFVVRAFLARPHHPVARLLRASFRLPDRFLFQRPVAGPPSTLSPLSFWKISPPLFCKMRLCPRDCKRAKRINHVEIHGEMWKVWKCHGRLHQG